MLEENYCVPLVISSVTENKEYVSSVNGPVGVKYVFKFADDTKIFRCSKDSMDSSILQKDLYTIIVWADKWQMDFNVSKCKVMHV